MAARTIPGFSRVEIRTRDKRDIANASAELRRLADELQRIGLQPITNETATILAHHKIKETSQKLRGTADEN